MALKYDGISAYGEHGPSELRYSICERQWSTSKTGFKLFAKQKYDFLGMSSENYHLL